MSIYIYYLIFGDISIWRCNFFGSQAKKLDLSSSLSLILSSSLAWLINQAKSNSSFLALSQTRVQTLFLGLSQGQVKLEHLIFIDESSSNTHYSTKLDSFITLARSMSWWTSSTNLSNHLIALATNPMVKIWLSFLIPGRISHNLLKIDRDYFLVCVRIIWEILLVRLFM